MAQAKIEVKFGNICFSGEGDSAWLESQLDKLLAAAVNGTEAPAAEVHHGAATRTGKAGAGAGSLAAFLKAQKATTNQVRKFLATACWLSLKGENNLTTALVTKSLTDNRQLKLTNPADCLNQNVRKGYCEKQGKKGFFVTEEGTNSLETVAE
ncbi:hypothetical protein [uncultured Paludibaculum sp.]|uniref:hypothetical protein n=1 Tax=uncultured Paludibaculum sp. TaxID=1765020 RepID=UPI002AAAA47C|nr:hypothetical protein [uncultured Paludibaculum sp.]